MKKNLLRHYVTTIVTIIMALTITSAGAQSTTPTSGVPVNCPTYNTKTPVVNKFIDIVELNFTGVRLAESSNACYMGMAVGLTNIVAYEVANNFYTGVGIGYEGAVDNENYGLVPISGDVRWYLSKKKIAPFINLNSGYSFYAARQPEGAGDIFTGLNFGLNTTKNNIGIQFALGLKYEHFIYPVATFNPDNGTTRIVSHVYKDYLYLPVIIGVQF